MRFTGNSAEVKASKYAIELKYFDKPKLAIKTFGWSITYLMLLFILMLVDHYFFYNPIDI